MSSKQDSIKMYKCYVGFLIIGFIPFCIYGTFLPFTKSYLIILYTLYIFLNFFYFLVATHIEELFILLYFLVAGTVGGLLFLSVLNYIYIIPMVFLGALVIAFIFYKTVKQKYFRNILIAAQALFFLLISFSLLNLNMLHIAPSGLHILHYLTIFQISPFILFVGYSSFNLGKMLNSHELLRNGVYSTFALLYLSLGITLLLADYGLSILAAICFLLGLIATIFLYSYSNKERNKAKRKNRGKKK